MPDAQRREPARTLISVVVPCYNGAATLPQTLRSLRRQTFPHWEAIVVDDGSGDDTAAVAEAWSRKDPRIRLLKAEHGGVARAWNHGIAAATAPWLAFLDCDDWLARDAYARLLRLSRKRPFAGVVMGSTTLVLPNGRERPFLQPDLHEAFEQLCFQGRIAIHSAILKRSLAVAIGGFDPSLETHEDWDFWQRLARMGVEFAQTDAVVAYYRANPGSLSRQVRQFAIDGLEVMSRGHAPDPRVPEPSPAYAAGWPRDELPMRRLYFGLWSAARDVVAGGDGQEVAALLEGDPPAEFEPRDLGELVAAGMADMAACDPAELGPRWAEFEPKLKALFDRLRQGPEWARLTSLALGVIKARLNGGAPRDDDVLDLDRPSAPPGLGADPPPVLQLRRGRRSLGAIALAASGPTSPGRLAEMVAEQAARLPRSSAVQALAPWTSWPFWRAASADLLRPAPLAVLAPRTALRLGPELARQRLRTAAVAGMRAAVAARLRRLPGAAAPTTTRAAAPPAAEPRAAAAASPVPAASPPRRSPRRVTYSLEAPILMYHRIASSGGPARYRVTPEAFAQQIRLLRAHDYRTITPDELAETLARGRPFPGRPVLLTFDDAYEDFYDQAWPVLQAAGYTATVFAVAGKLEDRAADWDGCDGAPALMGAERLRTLSEAGVAIGSHAFSHRPLTHMPVADAYREALTSLAALEAAIRNKVTTFCYPYGAHDPVAEQVVEASGYRLAMTAIPGLANLASAPLRLPRLEIRGGDDLQTFSRKLRIK